MSRFARFQAGVFPSQRRYLLGSVLLMLMVLLGAAPLTAQTDSCLDCHRKDAVAIEHAESIHAAYGISCAACHGGDPTKQKRREAEAASAGFKGPLKEAFDVIDACVACHDDQPHWRHVGLPADTFKRYQQGEHGFALLEKENTDAANCRHCHASHRTRKVSDPESRVHPLNTNDTCANCHGDADYISSYEYDSRIPQWVAESVHGVWDAALFPGEAPSCAGCHGGHRNRSPKKQQIYNLCGRCHEQERAQFTKSNPHWHETVNCVVCHTSHQVTRPQESMFGAKGVCRNCHDAVKTPSGEAERYLLEVQQLAERMRARLDSLDAVLGALRAEGFPLVRLEQAARRVQLRWRRSFGLTQHSLNLPRLKEVVQNVGASLENVEQLVNDSKGRRRQDRLVLVISAALLLVVAGALLQQGRKDS